MIYNNIAKFGLLSLIAGMSLYASVPNNFPDQTYEANSLATPYTYTPAHPVQLGALNRQNPLPPAPNSVRLYNQLNSYFKKNVWSADMNNLHFDFNAFKGTHPSLAAAPTLRPSLFRAYFVDAQSSFNNALGVFDHGVYGAYPAGSKVNPISPFGQSSPMNNVPKAASVLLFPFARDAMAFTPGGTNPSNHARYANNPFQVSGEHPLLFTDMVEYKINHGNTIDLFLAADTNNISMSKVPSTLVPISQRTNLLGLPNNGLWSTDKDYNYTDPKLANFQHFAFYNLPEMGHNWYLVGVEDQGVLSGSDKDFNDLLFVVHCPVPEPQTYAIVGSLLMLAFVFSRKRAAQLQQ